MCEVHTLGTLSAVFECHFLQAHGVRGVRRTHHDDQVCARSDFLDSALAVGGCVADVVRGRILQGRETLTQTRHGFQGLIHGQGGLRNPHNLLGVADRYLIHFLGRVHDLDVLGRLTGGTLDLFVAGVADEQDVVVLLGEAHSLAVHLVHQRAGRVNSVQGAVAGCGNHRRGHAVRREHGHGTFGNFVHFINEDSALLLQGLHHVAVVNNLLAHVDGRAVVLQRLLNSNHGTVNARAVTARGGEQDFLLTGDGCGGFNVGAAAALAGYGRQAQGNSFSGHGYYPTLFGLLVCDDCGTARRATSQGDEANQNTEQQGENRHDQPVACRRLQVPGQ